MMLPNCYVRNAGGYRAHFGCFAGSCLTVWLRRQRSVLARNRTWSTTFAESCASTTTPRGQSHQHPGPDSNRDHGLRRSVCSPLHHQDKKSRRLDLHQHNPTYEIGA